MKNEGIKASSIRKLLSALMVLLILGAAAGFYFGIEQVREVSVDVSHTVADADASGKQIEKLQQLKSALAQRQALVDKASQLFATEGNYQSQALTDIQKYANTYGLTVSKTNFGTGTDTQSGVTGHPVTVTLQSPVPYNKFIQFLDAIEGNLPKMQITNVELGHTSDGGPNDFTTKDIKITISTR